MSDDEDSDKEGEQEGNERDRIANELFEGDEEEGEEEDDTRSRMTKAETEAQDLTMDGSEEEDGQIIYNCVLNTRLSCKSKLMKMIFSCVCGYLVRS